MIGLLRLLSLGLILFLLPTSQLLAQQPQQKSEMAGYLLVPNDRVPEEFDAGFSMYVAAWPLLDKYPGSRFQTGLFGTWMHANYDEKPTERLYSDIEGGLGWWRDTRFATATPKFIMGGVALNFVEWANGPGAGKGRDWDQPSGKYAVVQLSPWVLWPPDGLNLKQGTSGEMFGYGYLPLPLTEPKTTTAGKDVPTGNQCWTLFLNTGNFKGPVTFFAPYFWSQVTVDRPELAGMFLDSRPANPNRALQMETQYVPAQLGEADGGVFARVAPTLFPANSEPGQTALVHKVSSYRKAALWDSVQAWFAGGPPTDGQIDPDQSVIHRFPGHGGATWKIYDTKTERDDRVPLDWKSFATPTAIADDTFGYRWNMDLVQETNFNGQSYWSLPQYYQLTNAPNNKQRWTVVEADQVPATTQLHDAKFAPPQRAKQQPYVTPDDPQSCWKTPGPVAGPFKAYPGDGSEITYYWYRFADQPALLNADLTDEQREALQKRVELLHRNWTKEREYLPPPRIGELADIDPALILTPPKGLEVGYVPIVTKQGEKE